LCKKLAEYDKIKVEEDFIEGANRIESTIHPPIRQFINEHYADIIAINKQYRKEDGEDTDCDILKNLNLSKEKKTALESLQRVFEDGANKYPRLIHLVLEWPLFSRMPKPPRDMLDFCDQQEYDRMLEHRKKDVFNSVGGFSGIETQSTYWFLYPKGESWNKDSGIKRFQDLLIDTHKLLGCDWLKLLHKHVGLMSPWSVSADGWDGLFDEDYDLQEEGYRKGLYKNYYITDVFYESIRLCRKLLDSETGQEIESIGTQPELTDTEQNIIEALDKNKMNGEPLAKKTGYPYNSNFKNTLSSLRKRGILGNKSPGYFLEPAYYYLLNEPDKSQDKGQD
jgi:hypothetical protein